jgi:outer membrane protein assembly factor BamA
VIRAYCDFDTGTVYDSAAVRRAERLLRATRLFLSVNIVSLPESYGYDIIIMVAEYPIYWTFPPSLDINHYYYLHGLTGNWYCPSAGIDLTNLGGRAEDLGAAAQIGVWQNYDAYWIKPLYPSKYFIGVSASYGILPDPSKEKLDLEEVSEGLMIGRRFFERSKGYCSIAPDYRQVITDSIGKVEAVQHQVYGTIGWLSDLRSSAFDPSRGTWFRLEAKSNYCYHDPAVAPYVQFNTDVKWYIPFLFPDAKFAFHLQGVLRTDSGGYFNRLLIGGINSVRGYYTEEIGLDTSLIANDGGTFSCEYRFPLYQFPPISVFLPEDYSKMLGTFSGWAPRLDGALIADWGRVSDNVKDLFQAGSAGSRSGCGVGFGIRVTEPTLKLTLCSDFIWSESLEPGVESFGPRRLWNLYSGINF